MFTGQTVSRKLQPNSAERWPHRAGPRSVSEADFSAAKLYGLKEANRILLIGDDLGLPNDRDGHQAHKKHANRQSQVRVRLSCRETKGANQPGHEGFS
jgi:hypothetical protein